MSASHSSGQTERLAPVLLWANVKRHLSLRTLCTDMPTDGHTHGSTICMCCTCDAGAGEAKNLRICYLDHCSVCFIYKVEPSFNMYLNANIQLEMEIYNCKLVSQKHSI